MPNQGRVVATPITALGLRSWLATAVAVALAATSAWPARPGNPLGDLTLEELAEVRVITSSRTTPVAAADAPATVVIVTAEQIRLRNYQSLLDVLLDLPDVKVDTANDPRWMSDVSVRGIWGMDKLIIMVDGVKVSSPTNDTIPIMENYPVHFARQIEIAYGPASALYGADAFSGVVNIISKTTADVDGSGEVSVLAGTEHATTTSLLFATELGAGVELVVAGLYHADRQPDLAASYPEDFAGMDEALASGTFPTIFGPITPTTPVSTDTTSPLRAYGVHAALSAGDFRLSLFSNYSRNPTSIANKPVNSVYNREVAFEREINVLSAAYEIGGDELTSSTYLTASTHELLPESEWRNVYTAMEPSYQYSYGRMLKAEQLFTFDLGPSLELAAGATYEDFVAVPDTPDLSAPISGRHDLQGIIVNSDIYPLSPDGIPARFFTLRYDNLGGLLEARYTPHDELAITVGGRYDSNSRYGSSFNPRLGVVWRPTAKVVVKGLYGEAFLAPSPYAAFKEFGSFVSFDDGATFQSFFMLLSNPDLQPQENRSAELALHYLATPELNLTWTLYSSWLDGLFAQVNDADYGNRYGGIYPVEGSQWPIAYVETVVNLGDQHTWGATMTVDHRHQVGEVGVRAYGSLSYIDGDTDLDGPGPRGSVEMGGIAEWTLKAGVDLAAGRWTASPRLVWLDDQRTHPLQLSAFSADEPSRRQRVDGYALLNLDVRCQVTEQVTAFLRASNVLDQRYRTVNLGAAPDGLAAGSAAAEFEDGAPQDPLRAMLGVTVGF